MPLAFLGFALWRAWVSLSYANPAYASPLFSAGGKDLYDLFLAIASIIIALCARSIAPLNEKRWAYLTCGIAMTASTGASLIAIQFPETAAYLSMPGTILAGVGSAFLILIWCEIYCCLNPVRAAIYLSLSMALGVVLTFILQGFRDPYLLGSLVVLPVLSLMLAHRAYRSLDQEDRPDSSGRLLFPWKFIAVLVLYDIVNGLCTARLGAEYAALVGSHSTLATLIAASALFACVYFFSGRFDFSLLYRSPMVLMVCGLLFIPLFGLGGSVVGAFCVSVSTTLFGCIIFLFLCDISKRLGVIAIWLFGIEEATLVFGWAGRGLADGLQAGFGANELAEPITSVIAILLIIALTAILLSEREIGTRWGIRFMDRNRTDEQPPETARVFMACEELAEKRNLSPREEEVLKILAQGKSLSAVARELFIAEGTAKAHTRHIYEKLGINTRQELFDLLLINPRT